MINPIKIIQNSNLYKMTCSNMTKAEQKVFDAVPNVTVSNEKTLKRLDWLGKEISSAENRLILGVTAIMSQPFIDLANKDVDEKTRKVSAARTVAKIVAGTLTGVLIRKGCIYAANNFTKIAGKVAKDGTKKTLSKWDTLLTPTNATNNDSKLKDYVSAMGTLLALGVMTFTNFAIDAPLTKYLTNKLIQKSDNIPSNSGGKQ